MSLLAATQVSKRFGGVQALHEVFDLVEGQTDTLARGQLGVALDRCDVLASRTTSGRHLDMNLHFCAPCQQGGSPSCRLRDDGQPPKLATLLAAPPGRSQ